MNGNLVVIALAALAVYSVTKRPGPAVAAAGLDLTTPVEPVLVPRPIPVGPFPVGPVLVPTPAPTFTPQTVGGPDILTNQFTPDFDSALDEFESGGFDLGEFGVQAGKSATRTVIGTIDPLASITRLIPGVPTVGPLFTPVDFVLDLF